MSTLRRILFLSLIVSLLLSSCSTPSTPPPTPTLIPSPTLTPVPATDTHPTPVPAKPAFETGVYRNLFAEYLGKTDAETQAKLDAAWKQLFYGNDDLQRVYYPVGSDMAYIEDIGNQDVRSEGMSYGMMIAVQLDKKEEFDRIWKWTKTYMYQTDGPYKGYFAWHCTTDGAKLDQGPASDGEEWFATALFFASNRWGDGSGILNYSAEAQAILDTMLHKEDQNSDLATNMFNAKAKQVVFVPKIGPYSGFTDPSYHLPAYYELWARWAKQDNQFWTDAAQTSRAFLKTAANPKTGLMADYANFDGTPHGSDDHKDFRFDAWRTLSNVAVDYAWFAADPWQVEQSNRVLDFLASQGMDSYPNQYSLDGKPLSSDRSTGLSSMAAVAALAADPAKGKPFVQALWDTDTPQGKWRYYDGMLYLLALLHDSGNFRVYKPGSSK
jgi:oligosaccharide reducing-end xylanase